MSTDTPSSQLGVSARDEHVRLEFVAFLYAAAIHLLIHHAASSEVTLGKAFLVSFIVLYFMTDWLARFRLPAKAEDMPYAAWVPSSEIWKLMLEVFGLTFLTLAAIGVIHRISGSETTVHGYTLEAMFAFFVFSTFLWNLLVFRNMGKADWLPLAQACFLGNASSSVAEETYLKQFKKYREELAQPGSNTGLKILPPILNSLRVAFGEVTAQFLAFHLALSHLAVFCFLMASVWRESSEPLFTRFSGFVSGVAAGGWGATVAMVFFCLAASVVLSKFIGMWRTTGVLSLVLLVGAVTWYGCPLWVLGKEMVRALLVGSAFVVAPSLLFFSLAHQGDGLGRVRWAGASWLSLGLVASYAAMPSEHLIGVFALQQFAVGLVLQLLVTTQTDKTPKVK